MINQNILPILLKAMDNARDGITISDATQKDMPLIYVNEGFLKMTGYDREEVLGKNCRFLQGTSTSQAGVETLRQAIKNKKETLVELLNYRKNGEPFWNKLSMTPIFGEGGNVIYFIGVQDDISTVKEKAELQQMIERQRLVTQTTIMAQEKERKFIGAELHDNINQLLATARLYINLGIDQEENRMEMIRSGSELINHSIEEIRKLSHNLVGPKAGNWQLEEALQDLLQSVQIGACFETSLQWHSFDEAGLPEETKITLYRIAQEQLSNIVKYANGKKVSVVVGKENGELTMHISDDGVGFDPEKKQNGIGLRNMQTRLELINGRMELQTSPGKGCRLMVWIP